jgi:hypothetical protein
MVLTDDRVLEYLRENETGGATEMAESGLIPYTRGYISQRLSKLADHNLVKPLGNGVYRITERGERYLDGELNTSEDAPDEVPDVNGGPTAGGDEEQA